MRRTLLLMMALSTSALAQQSLPAAAATDEARFAGALALAAGIANDPGRETSRGVDEVCGLGPGFALHGHVEVGARFPGAVPTLLTADGWDQMAADCTGAPTLTGTLGVGLRLLDWLMIGGGAGGSNTRRSGLGATGFLHLTLPSNGPSFHLHFALLQQPAGPGLAGLLSLGVGWSR